MTIAKKNDLTSADDVLSVGDEDALQHAPHDLQEHHRPAGETDGWLRHGIVEVTPHSAVIRDKIVQRVRRATRKPSAQTSEPPADEVSVQEQIRLLAYQFFEQRGYEHGHDVEDWLRAEEMILRRQRRTAA